jgi:hypothetical protein
MRNKAQEPAISEPTCGHALGIDSSRSHSGKDRKRLPMISFVRNDFKHTKGENIRTDKSSTKVTAALLDEGVYQGISRAQLSLI